MGVSSVRRKGRLSLCLEEGPVAGNKADFLNAHMCSVSATNSFGRAQMPRFTTVVAEKVPPKNKSRHGCNVDTVLFEDDRMREAPSESRKIADQGGDRVI